MLWSDETENWLKGIHDLIFYPHFTLFSCHVMSWWIIIPLHQNLIMLNSNMMKKLVICTICTTYIKANNKIGFVPIKDRILENATFGHNQVRTFNGNCCPEVLGAVIQFPFSNSDNIAYCMTLGEKLWFLCIFSRDLRHGKTLLNKFCVHKEKITDDLFTPSQNYFYVIC